nr:hypothetical protein [Tanacetum cinerariifolium]
METVTVEESGRGEVESATDILISKQIADPVVYKLARICTMCERVSYDSGAILMHCDTDYSQVRYYGSHIVGGGERDGSANYALAYVSRSI